jgi:hypothetical protein
MPASFHTMGAETVRSSALLSQCLCATNCEKLGELACKGLTPLVKYVCEKCLLPSSLSHVSMK